MTIEINNLKKIYWELGAARCNFMKTMGRLGGEVPYTPLVLLLVLEINNRLIDAQLGIDKLIYLQEQEEEKKHEKT